MYHKVTLEEIDALPKAVIFDFDNTICDSWPQLIEAWNTMLTEHGKQPMSRKEILELPHEPQDKLIADIFAGETEENTRQIIQHYWEIYETVHQSPPILIQSAYNLINTLYSNKIYCAIVSNTKGSKVRNHCESHKISHMFSKILGSGDIKFSKPHPSAIIEALPTEYISPIDNNTNQLQENIWYIGDSPQDILAAKNAHVLPIWATEKATQFLNLNPVKSYETYPVLPIQNLANLADHIRKLVKLKLQDDVPEETTTSFFSP